MDEPGAGWELEEDEPGTIREVVVTVAIALLLAWFAQGYIVKPFRIPSGSMENTLRCGDRVLVNRLSYRMGDPSRGDVVVFHPPAAVDADGRPDPSLVSGDGDAIAPRDEKGARTVSPTKTNYIKRIVGMPGDRVEVKDHRAYVDGRKLDEPYLHPLPRDAGISSESSWGPYTVPKGTYLMMGDHRDNSSDGRVFGFVPREFVVGKAFMVYWPPQRIGGLPAEDPGGTSDAKPDPKCLEAGFGG
jgi:signal peptidase I